MTVPPMVLDLAITSPDTRPVRVWVPLFLLWPLLLALGVLALVLTAIADVVLLLMGRPYHRYTMLLLLCFRALCETRGMVVRVNDDKAAVSMTVQ